MVGSRRYFPYTSVYHALAIISRILVIISLEGPYVIFFNFFYWFFSRLFGYNCVTNLIRGLIFRKHVQDTLWQWDTCFKWFEYIFWIRSWCPSSNKSPSSYSNNDFFFIVSFESPSHLIYCINIRRFTWLLSIYFCKKQAAHLIISWIFRGQLGDMIW